MTFVQALLAGGASFIASGINAGAGGGSFISFPATAYFFWKTYFAKIA